MYKLTYLVQQTRADEGVFPDGQLKRYGTFLSELFEKRIGMEIRGKLITKHLWYLYSIKG